ncbi:hypothetical protein [Nocardia sp. NPDC049707]|uniref:hypothetical protein n=1 Tax=Nocardia sp. NPDC049707 TaxID=3154735 RepID=UPI003444EE43
MGKAIATGRSGVSGTAQGPLTARFIEHNFGTRQNEAADRLMRALPGVPRLGLRLTAGPLLLAHRLAGAGGSIDRMTDERSERSFLPLTDEHLSRLARFAETDHMEFCRTHPEWAADLLACCLVQGGARHYVYGDRGVKDLDVYLFYGLPPGRSGEKCPWNRYTRRRDFGVSELVSA